MRDKDGTWWRETSALDDEPIREFSNCDVNAEVSRDIGFSAVSTVKIVVVVEYFDNFGIPVCGAIF